VSGSMTARQLFRPRGWVGGRPSQPPVNSHIPLSASPSRRRRLGTHHCEEIRQINMQTLRSLSLQIQYSSCRRETFFYFSSRWRRRKLIRQDQMQNARRVFGARAPLCNKMLMRTCPSIQLNIQFNNNCSELMQLHEKWCISTARRAVEQWR